MSDASLDDRVRRPLGAATERLFEEAFAKKALLTTGEAAAFLGIGDQTLSAATEAGLVGSTKISAQSRRYSERDLRIYLTSGNTTAAEHLRERVSRAQASALAAWRRQGTS